MAKVLCTSSHPVDLSDGRTLAPGEGTDKVDTDHPHQRGLVLDGHLLVQEGTKPRARQAQRLVEAAKSDDEQNEKE